MSKTKKPSGIRAFFGAIVALGIFAGLMLLSNPDLQVIITERLRADVTESTLVEPTITSFTPTEGVPGDQIYITVKNWQDFTEEKTAVFFGSALGEVSAIGDSSDSEKMIVVQVPELTEVGEYTIKVTTPNGMLESSDTFALTEASAKASTGGNIITNAIDNPDPVPAVEPVDLIVEPEATKTDTTNTTQTKISSLSDAYQESVATTPTQTPVPTPTNLNVQSNLNGIQLSWTAPSQPVDKYNIYYGSLSGHYLHRVIARDTEYILTGLENGKVYFFQVRAVNTSGQESNGSNEVSAIFSTVAAPETSEPAFHASSPKPPELSEEGPGETLLISLVLSTGIALWIYRKRALKNH